MLLLVLNLAGTFAFGLSGGMAGVRERLDLFGVVVLAVVGRRRPVRALRAPGAVSAGPLGVGHRRSFFSRRASSVALPTQPTTCRLARGIQR